jgi:hypothetical protein
MNKQDSVRALQRQNYGTLRLQSRTRACFRMPTPFRDATLLKLVDAGLLRLEGHIHAR